MLKYRKIDHFHLVKLCSLWTVQLPVRKKKKKKTNPSLGLNGPNIVPIKKARSTYILGHIFCTIPIEQDTQKASVEGLVGLWPGDVNCQRASGPALTQWHQSSSFLKKVGVSSKRTNGFSPKQCLTTMPRPTYY